MIVIKTNKVKTVYNERFKVIGDFYLYITIRELIANENDITANGFYYYLDSNEQLVKLKDFSTKLDWVKIQYIEQNMLSPLNTIDLKNAMQQRIQEFTIIQLTQESGDNFGTVIEDWV
jgi:hypothetical protein